MSSLFKAQNFVGYSFYLYCIFFVALEVSAANSDFKFDAKQLFKNELKIKAHEMFMHGYNGYMKYAFPHDELMPVSCKGRERGVTPSRGDVDDSLGNFSLTLVDTLDTLVVVGEYDEFVKAVKLIVDNVRFDADLVVSVFETNIRMVGGLISGHLMSILIKNKFPGKLEWYTDELLKMAAELSDRLLPAFNTTSGVPHSRINLKHGMLTDLKNQPDTCTACGGTMILEWAALSRLSGNPIYEEKARRAMDFLWNQRNRGSDLMGTVLNVNSGDWIRRDSGIGAGIDSYYEYTLKAYILLGEDDFLYRFNKHYKAVMRYLNKGPMFIDVHMHKPNIASRSFMDALLAFWPGVQVLKGDLKSAIEMHEMLHNVVKKHKFLPDAFTHDLQVHWGQHPLRPEFIESTYFLYRATKDPHYLDVARQVMTSLEENVRTSCGFAAVKDVRTMDHEDQMESFVLAETFKYLYMIFAESSDLIFDPDNYVLTTEAHFLPLSIGETSKSNENLLPRRMLIDPDEIIEDENNKNKRFKSVCPNVFKEFRNTKEIHSYGVNIRESVSKLLKNFNLFSTSPSFGSSSASSCLKATERLKAWAFSATNVDHLAQLSKMGIEVEFQSDGRLKLSQSAQAAINDIFAQHGILFMQELSEMMLKQEREPGLQVDRVVQIVSQPHFGQPQFIAFPAQFGTDLASAKFDAELTKAQPFQGCEALQNADQLAGRIAIILRGGCTFQDKARHAQSAGTVGLIIIDNQVGTSSKTAPLFAMSSDNNVPDDVQIPVVFLFHLEGLKLMNQLLNYPAVIIRLAQKVGNPATLFEQYLINLKYSRQKIILSNYFLTLNSDRTKIRFNFRFNQFEAEKRKMIVEKNIEAIKQTINFSNENVKTKFLNYARVLAYSLLGYPHQLNDSDYKELRFAIRQIKLLNSYNIKENTVRLEGPVTSTICNLRDSEKFSCGAT